MEAAIFFEDQSAAYGIGYPVQGKISVVCRIPNSVSVPVDVIVGKMSSEKLVQRRRILFCLQNLYLGGVPRALSCLLPILEQAGFDVEIFCPSQDGPFWAEFLKRGLIRQDTLLRYCSLDHRAVRSLFRRTLVVFIKALRVLSRFLGNDIYYSRLSRWARFFCGKYDVVVAYSEGDMTEMVAKISASLKISWVHIDYKRFQVYNQRRDESGIYACFDRIVSPSRFSADSFSEVYPQLKDRVFVVPNVVDADAVLLKSRETENLDSRFDTTSFTIVSVGRICGEKQFYRIPEIARRISEDFKWFIIGGGSKLETDELLSCIAEEGMQDKVVWLGPKENPYPYLRQADLLVSLSLSETFSYAIYEAKILHVPVIAAPFGSAEDVFSDGFGQVLDVEAIPAEIHRMIRDVSYYKQCKSVASRYAYRPDISSVVGLFNE